MPQHVVVDGSNLATEGRAMPSLQQLNEAVLAYIAEHPDALITVVVDATFGHRIDSSEVAEFDAAVANNEIVAPPAGAIGRGDAFVLSIANKVQATILTNDSYQEFHGAYAWLFDEGRLVGGKPVPHIGWVFVSRSPVRGPLSRKSMSDSKRKGRGTKQGEVRQGSPEASKPMPVPTAPPPGALLASKAKGPKAAAAQPAAEIVAKQSPRTHDVNDLLPFLTFVELHPPGSSVSAVVDNYSSHGAYVSLGDVRGYVPLRLMADPPPRSAREFMKVGESVTLVVESFAAARRSIDLAMPAMATAKLAEQVPTKRATRKKQVAAPVVVATADEAPIVAVPPPRRVKKAAAGDSAPRRGRSGRQPTAETVVTPQPGATTRPPSPARKRAAKKQAAPVEEVASASDQPAPKVTRKRATKKVAAPPEPAPAPVRAPRRRRPPAS